MVGFKNNVKEEKENVIKDIEFKSNPIGLHQGIIAHH